MKTCSVFPFFLSFIYLLSACTGAPALETPTVVDMAGIHTSVPKTTFTMAAFTQTVTPSPPSVAEELSTQTPELTHVPTQPPVEISVPPMENVPTLTGYNTPGIRVLERPVAIVRDGIRLVVEQVIVFSDHIELVYTVRNIPHAILLDPFTDDTAFVCGGPASYPNLVLSDGTVIYPESYLLDGKSYGQNDAFARSYLIHIYKAEVPAEVSEMKFVLDCLELARLDRSPRNWEVSFRIVPKR
jgi:hypothetical protein